jgi:hypothetical protein
MTLKISKSIIKKIEQEKIEPRSKMFFFLRNSIFIGGGIIFFLFGVVGTAIIFHFWNHLEFAEFLWKSPLILIKILTFGVPFFWFIFAIILGVFTNFMARKSPRGYKIPIVLGIGVLLFLQIASGFFLEKSNIGDAVDEVMEHRISFYKGAEKMRNNMWRSVEDGFLAGEIIEIKSDVLFLLDDSNQKEWEIKCKECSEMPFLDKILKIGKKVKMVGKKTGEKTFETKMVRPFKRPFLPPPPMMEGERRGDRERPRHPMMEDF